MRRPAAPGAALMLVATLACTEKLTAPVNCPELCPGESLIVRDTVLLPLVGMDSSYTGYLAANEVPALLVSDGLAAGEARAFADFPKRSDSISVDGLQYAYTIDSVAIGFGLLARDSMVPGLRLLLRRITPGTDTTATFEAVDSAFRQGALVDSILVADTLKTGTVRLVLKGDTLSRLDPAEADSGRIGLAVGVRASAPTGVRLASLLDPTRRPTMITYVHVPTPDTTRRKQTITATANNANYVIAGPPPPGADVLALGGRSGTRSLIRFAVPAALRDSASVLRATLELTPAAPILGLPNDPGTLQFRGLLADLGPKSVVLAGVAGSLAVPAGAIGVQSADVRSIVSTWFTPNPPPSVIFIGLFPEGGSFARAEFQSSRAASDGPRLRVTYALPSRPGHP
ncbi:MAG TPA: hypothetical protein VGQ17_16015 [Gemmatimonadales bacterium]|nr:hypothetical protein [Gemmatimonadales bacterium]